MGPGLVAEQPTVPTAGESINCAARSKYDCRAALRLAVSLGVTASRLLLCLTVWVSQLHVSFSASQSGCHSFTSPSLLHSLRTTAGLGDNDNN